MTDSPLSTTPKDQRALAIMAKAPVAGRSKTRLMPVMSAQSAANIAEAFLLDAVALATELAGKLDGLVPVVAGAPTNGNTYFDDMTFGCKACSCEASDSRASDATVSDDTASNDTSSDDIASDDTGSDDAGSDRATPIRMASSHVAPEIRHLAQRGDGLNQRLDSVLGDLLDQGFEQVVAINADSPTLPIGLLEQAFAHLDEPDVDVVFGPAEDGGYYLIGCKAHHSALVRNVTMSTPTVLRDSLSLAAQMGLQVALLEPWYDVDEPVDLVRLRSDVDAGAACGPSTLAFLRDHPRLGRTDDGGARATTSNPDTSAQ